MNKLKVLKLLFMMSPLMQFSLTTSAQVLFEKGFITLNDGNRTECYIKNLGWRYSPEEVTYKLSENGEAKTGKVDDVSEFEVAGTLKYKRYTVDIDQSEESLNKISDSKEPEYQKQQVFLKVLAEGKATLLEYENNSIAKYFIQFGNENPEPLIHKTYRPDQTSALAENNTYKNQLRAWFSSGKVALSDIENLNYNKHDLMQIVKKFNESTDGKTIVYNSTDKKSSFHLRVRPGVTFNDLQIQNVYYPYRTTNFGYKIGPRIGLEAEIVLPFNRNKWAIIFEPAFNHYSSTYTQSNYHALVTYNSIETHVGPRYYFYLKKDQRVFVNASFIIDLPFSSKFHENVPYNDVPFSFTIGQSAGVGYMVNKRIGIECRYSFMSITRKNFTEGKNSNYKGPAVIFSYTIL